MNYEDYKTQSQRERQALKIIADFQKTKGYSPSYSDIAAVLGVTKSRVAQIVESLIAKNILSKDGNKARTLQIV